MSMFLGEYQTKFSGVRRIVLPRKFRDQLQGLEKIILSRGLDQCVWGFDLNSWQQQADKQLEASIVDVKARDLRRYLFSAAEEAELDNQGRFVIPAALLRYAAIETEVVIIGAGDHFEIWDMQRWSKFINRLEERIR